MRAALTILSAACLAVPAAPALAQRSDGLSRADSHVRSGEVRVHRGDGDWRRDRRVRRDRRDGADDVYFGYREYQGDTLWRSGGFNDWWHDRPDRSFPRWVATNQDCERQYYTGNGWRC